MKDTYRIDYEWNSNWTKITRIVIQQHTTKGWTIFKSEPYTGSNQEKEWELEVTKLNGTARIS